MWSISRSVSVLLLNDDRAVLGPVVRESPAGDRTRLAEFLRELAPDSFHSNGNVIDLASTSEGHRGQEPCLPQHISHHVRVPTVNDHGPRITVVGGRERQF